MSKSPFNQRGQIFLAFALLLPILLIIVGLVIDFGRWYSHKARLQNSADAAVLAGADRIASVAAADKEDPQISVNLVSEVPESYSNDDTATESTNGDVIALEYANKNSYGEKFNENENFEHYAYGDKETVNPMYYVVELKGKVDHIFSLMNRFGDMNIKLNAVAKVTVKDTPKEENPITPEAEEAIKDLEIKHVIIGNWEVQNYYRNHLKEYEALFGHSLFVGKWNHFKEPKKKIVYEKGNKYRTESITVKDGTEFATDANGNNKYSWEELETINIDFAQDVKFSGRFTEDWDIGYEKPTGITNMQAMSMSSTVTLDQLNFRVHADINFNAPYLTRPSKTYPDVLWARIESDPMWTQLQNKVMTQLNSVRQIILNMNASNMDEKYRPLGIFYEGPETNANNPFLKAEERPAYSNIRVSQPVILNLNADFVGFLYMPNSPVVLNGNGKKFQGFIVAKEYRVLKAAEDFYLESGKYYNNESKTKEYFKIYDGMFIDGNGNVQTKPYTGELNYGTYDRFFIKEFADMGYTIDQSATNNLFTSSN